MENTINSELIRGNINTIILKALYDGDRYGYDIIKEIEQKSGGQYILKQPTLYSCLKRLEVQGFIRSYWGGKTSGGRRKYYTLTDTGREFFLRYQNEWVYSRTVIDKLISDEQYDLNSKNDKNTEKNGTVDDKYDETLEEYDESEEEGEASEIDIPPSDPEIFDEMYNELLEDDGSEVSMPQTEPGTEKRSCDSFDEYENLERSRELFKIAAERNEHDTQDGDDTAVTEHEYVDTARIVDELYKRMQTNSEDDSYTDKLISDDYEASPQKKPEDSYDDYSDDGQDFTYDDLQDDEPIDEPPAETNADTAALKDNLPQNNDNYFPPVSAFPQLSEDDRNILERDYKQVLGQLVKNQSATINVPEAAAENQGYFPAPAIPPKETPPAVINDTTVPAPPSKFNDLSASLSDLGDDIYIREHNLKSAKEYNESTYYYPFRLMLLQYGILFGIMLVMTAFTFLLTSVGLKIMYTRDIIFYSLSIAVAAVFPIIAAILNFRNPEKTKRKQFNFKKELIYRLIIFINCLVVIYCINIYMGMPVMFSLQYLCTLMLPALLSLCFLLSTLIFNALLASGRYSVK